MLIDLGDDKEEEEDLIESKKNVVFQKLKSKPLICRFGENLNENGRLLHGWPTNIYEYLKMRLDDEMIRLT